MLQNKGFTMVEMIFVLSIILILSSFTLYNCKRNFKPSYSIVKNNISAVIDEAKDTALTQHQRIDLQFTAHKIQFVYNDKCINYLLPSGYYFDHLQEVYFNPYGSINQANHINLCFENSTHMIVFHLGAGDYYFK